MYSPNERNVFGPIWTGAAQTYCDPLRVYHRLLSALGGDPQRWLDRWKDPADIEARDKIIQAAGWALEMVPFDRATGTGATEAEVEHALRDYLGWMEGKEPRVASLPSSPRPTDSGTGPATSTTSASGSTSTPPASAVRGK